MKIDVHTKWINIICLHYNIMSLYNDYVSPFVFYMNRGCMGNCFTLTERIVLLTLLDLTSKYVFVVEKEWIIVTM